MSLRKILKIMKYALLNPEKYDEDYIKKKFKEKAYLHFSQFCLGGPSDKALAHYIGTGKLKLTQNGVREYHRLQAEYDQRKFNLLVMIATIVIALSSLIPLLT